MVERWALVDLGLTGEDVACWNVLFLKVFGVFFFFLTWTIFKVFIEFFTILLLFCFGFLAARHVGS